PPSAASSARKGGAAGAARRRSRTGGASARVPGARRRDPGRPSVTKCRVALAADRLNTGARDEVEPRLAVGRVRTVAADAGDRETVVVADRVIGVRTAPALFVAPPTIREDRGVAAAAFGRPQREPHAIRLAIGAAQETERVHARDRPDPDAHYPVGAPVTVDAAHAF